MSNWKWLVLALGFIAACIAALMVFRSVQRNRDLAETLLWIDQTYNPHEGGDNFGKGHGWEIHYSQKGQMEEVTEKFKMTLARLDGCNIAINWETFPEGFYRKTPSMDKFTMSLCDIDPESFKIKTHDLHSKEVFDCSDPEQVKFRELNCDNAEIDFLTRNGAPTISAESVKTFTNLTGKDHELKTMSKTNKCFLVVDDMPYAQRLVKALKHAVELCGGKASKF